MPEFGTSIDRRARQNVGDAVSEESVSCLTCFICSCKHLRVSSYDGCGDLCALGKIKFVERGIICEKLLYGSTNDAEQQSRDESISEQYFRHRFGQAVGKDPIWKENKYEWRREVKESTVKEVLLCCPKMFKEPKSVNMVSTWFVQSVGFRYF